MAAANKTTQQIDQIILASSSPFRQAILKQAGIPFVSVKAAVDEYQYQDSSPKGVAVARARAKAAAVAQSQPESLVIGCDQVLEFEGEALDKVTCEQEAYERLQRLSGKQHVLHSAVAFMVYQDELKSYFSEFCTTVFLTMQHLQSEEIRSYIAKGEWQGSVACYQFENQGVQLFSQVQGDTTSIVGLPMIPLVNQLRHLGINFLSQAQPPWQLSLKNLKSISWADVL